MEQLTPEQIELIRSEIRQELKQQNKTSFKEEFAGLAGIGAGAALGAGMINPIENTSKLMQAKKDLKTNDLAMSEINLYKALRDIQDGNASFDDFGDMTHSLRALSKDPNVQAMISDDNAFKKQIESLSEYIRPQAATEFNEAKQIKNMVPFKGLTAKHLTHPLVSLGSIAGAAGGHGLYNYLKDKNQYNS